MRIRRIVLLAAGVMVLALTVSGTNAAPIYSFRTESVKYTQVTGDVTGAPGFDCRGSDPDFGGVGLTCFDLNGGVDVLVSNITIDDDYSPRGVGGYYEFRTSQSSTTAITSGSFCNSINNLAIPAGATWLGVWLDAALGPLDCGPAQLGVAIQGHVNTTIKYISGDDGN